MPWIDDDRYLTQSEMENNANIVIAYYRSIGINDSTIAGLLGNMQSESTLSPGLNERGSSNPGYGLVQWTPKSVLINDCNALGLSPYTDGTIQLQVIIQEILNNSSLPDRQWDSRQVQINNYLNSGATQDMVGLTGQQFLNNSMSWTPDKLAIAFMTCYLRPNYNPSKNHYTQRMQNALDWFTYMGGQPGTFTPRLDDTGIRGNFHYYSQNPFYQSGYGMPNCTCYAWGRFWEIGDPNNDGSNKPVNLPRGNGGQWYPQAVQDGYYQTGQTPQLGAVICFSDNNGGAGHVAIVEEIASDGTITCSNSAWQGTFFFLTYITPGGSGNGYNWSHYTCQGFIYNPHAIGPVPPGPGPVAQEHRFPWVLYARKLRQKGLL